MTSGDGITKRPRLGRTSVDLALAWVDAGTDRLETEQVPLREASGRVLGEDYLRSRADWGMAIESVACQYGLGFIPVQHEHYDFVVPKARLQRPSVQRFRVLLEDPSVREALAALGFAI